MAKTCTSEQVEREMRLAVKARLRGNEGMARVCARRAAGWAIGAWVAESALHATNGSAWSNLRTVATDVNQPSPVRLAAEHLSVRVNTEHTLPANADLLEDAKLLIQHFNLKR